MFASTIVLALLLGRVAAVQHRTDELIARRIAPSIVALQTTAADLRQLDILLHDRAVNAPGDPAVRDSRIAAARAEVAASERTYLALPHAVGEAPLRKALVASLDRFDTIVARSLLLPPGSDAAAAALRDLDRAYVETQTDVARATDSEAESATVAASQATSVSRLLLPSAVLLETLTFLAAVVAVALTHRSVRRAETLSGRARLSLERRADELEAFAGRVAHDMLSPLMTVGLALDLAQRRSDASSDTSTGAAIARASSTLQRVRAFVSDLLDFARAGARPPPGARAQVAEVVREVAEEFEPIAREAQVELRVDPVPPRVVHCSPGVLTSLLANLVQNAIKYVADCPERRVVVRELDADGQVRVEVEDTGPGIPSPEQDRLFEPFVRGRRAKAPGIGLGLATVRRLAEAHGGRSGVRSEPGKGSVFWFSLPAEGA